MTRDETSITECLHRGSVTEPLDLSRLMDLTYAELQRIAREQFQRESTGHTLQPTALVHETFLSLVRRRHLSYRNREHFLGSAAQQMRRILVDHARRKKAHKRGGGQSHIPLDDERMIRFHLEDTEVLRIHEALKELAGFNPEGARVVEMRIFAGLRHEEVAKVLGVSTSTARNRWRAARTWLHRELDA